MATEMTKGVPINSHNKTLSQPLSPPMENNHHNRGGSPLDALPKQFVLSMKTLFDILDDRQTGFVKFSDIEKGWQDDGCKGLPRGVIDSLRKVTPPSGLLSFERFCAGLKLCLLRNQTESGGNGSALPVAAATVNPKSPHKLPRPPSAPLFEVENAAAPMKATTSSVWSGGTTSNPIGSVRPHTHTHMSLLGRTQRTLSMPQLSPPDSSEVNTSAAGVAAPNVRVYHSPPPPPKPPRASVTAAAVTATATPPPPQFLDKAEIRNALQNWKMGILLNEMEGTITTAAAAPAVKDKSHNLNFCSPQHQQKTTSHALSHQYFAYRGCADGGSSSATDSGVNGATVVAKKSSSGKRREPRRHTLQNGIDYNMLKRLKQFEEEREVLLLGLGAVEKARDWYLQQVAAVQERIKYLGRMAGGSQREQWSEVQQERLNFQRARVLEVNRNLAVLADTWESGGGSFLQHFNLAIASGLMPASTSADARLRAQNRLLSNEVSLKSDCIALLEREKQALLHDLIEHQRMALVGSGGGARVSTSGGFVSVLSPSSPVCSSSSGGLGDADVVY